MAFLRFVLGQGCGEVESFYGRVYSVGGTYARASFLIEAWTWNPIDGWVCDECLQAVQFRVYLLNRHLSTPRYASV